MGILTLDNVIPVDVLDKLSKLDDVQRVFTASVLPYFVKIEKDMKIAEVHAESLPL